MKMKSGTFFSAFIGMNEVLFMLTMKASNCSSENSFQLALFSKKSHESSAEEIQGMFRISGKFHVHFVQFHFFSIFFFDSKKQVNLDKKRNFLRKSTFYENFLSFLVTETFPYGIRLDKWESWHFPIF